MKKRMLSILLIGLISMSAFSSCSSSNNSDSSSSRGDTESSSKTENSSESTTPTGDGPYDFEVPAELDKFYGKYDPPIKLTQNVSGAEDETNFYPGDNWTNNQFTEWSLGVAGIEWAPKWPAPDAETAKQKLTLGMATGDLPDIIQTDPTTIKQLAESGATIAVEDLFDEYASDITKAVYNSYTEAFGQSIYQPIIVDGKQMAVTSACDQVGPSNIWYREDEIKALGLEIPKTLEELETLFEVYKSKYPDKYCFMLNKDLYNVNNIFGAYGTYKGIWLNNDNELSYSSIQPEVKQALQKLQDWYKKGFIDKEFVVKDGAKVDEEFVAGNMLSYETGWWTIWGTAPNTLKNLPDAVLNAGPILTGADGKAGSIQSPPNYNYWSINKDCKNPEAAIKMLNWNMDSALRNDKALRDKYQFIYPAEPRKAPINNDALIAEGKDITFQESDYKKPGPGTASTWFYNRGNNRIYYGPFMGQQVGELSSEMKEVAEIVGAGSEGDTDEQKALLSIYKTYFMGFDMLKINGGNNAAYLATALDKGLAKIDAFLGLPTKTMTEKKAYLDKLELETFVKIITGEYDINQFDKFVSDWKSNGGDAITTEVNDWYKSVN